jgi:hypothetical protein
MPMMMVMVMVMVMVMKRMDRSVHERHYSTTTTTTTKRISTLPRAPLPPDATNRCELQYCSWNDGGVSSSAAADAADSTV